MDVLSSQANLAGYRAVIDAAAEYGRALPMMMTPAGTVPAAKVFVMGVGVAGLQAIATARRLGAIVTATDVRPATKEQVEVARRQIRRGRGRGVQAGRDRGRLRQGNVRRLQGQAGGADRRAHRQAGHRHHHRADPRPPGPAPGHRRHGRVDARRLGDRRPRGRARRQLRARAAPAKSWSATTASRSSAIPTCTRARRRPPRRSTRATSTPSSRR